MVSIINCPLILNDNENVSVQFNNSNVCKEDIIQGYRYRYNHIDCEHKKFTFIQKVPVHFAAPGSRLNSSFRCAKMRVSIALATLSCEKNRKSNL